ncbi:hypothetical protein TW81_03850 [Vibrio galatheae]|uniref:Lipoprotein n=1 Tax=Vibrio galatheae TaxID=579748 RepID=A0A0F4NP59_9VIBR|nr:FG-GAP repeat protein [Vibrio galatheae]KJY84669.1 hypothetical protein TW81_03850 [Vibrio galatheae]
MNKVLPTRKSYLLSSTLLLSVLFGCRGGTTYETETGVLADSAIGNAEYRCGSISGTTNEDGEFTCPVGSPIQFYTGSLKIGEVSVMESDNVVLVQDLLGVDRNETDNESVLLMAQLLQSLDDDDDSSNGIYLSANSLSIITEHVGSTEVDFSKLTEDDIVDIVGKASKSLVSQEDAKNHLDATTARVKASGKSGVPLESSDNTNTGTGDSAAVLQTLYLNTTEITTSSALNVGTEYRLTLNFDKDINSSGVSISSYIGATTSNISVSGRSISFTYLMPQRNYTSTASQLTEVLAVTASAGSISSSSSLSFLINDLANSKIQLTLPATKSTGVDAKDIYLNSHYMIVGSRSDNKVWIYDLEAGDISSSAVEISSSITDSGFYGHAVSMDNNYVVVGTPLKGGGTITLFKFDPNIISNTNNDQTEIVSTDLGLSDQYGIDVIVKNGYLIVGANNKSGGGQTYLYKIDSSDIANTVNSEVILNPIDNHSASAFGQSVDTNGDLIVVGASSMNSNGAVYVYKIGSTDLTNVTQVLKLTPPEITGGLEEFGYRVAISDDYILVGQPNYDANGFDARGTAWLYTIDHDNIANTANNPIQLIPAEGEISSLEFGNTLSLGGDYAIVGTNQNGAEVNAYLFDLSATDVNASQVSLPAMDYNSPSDGTSATVATNGSVSAIRAQKNGHVYLYKH